MDRIPKLIKQYQTGKAKLEKDLPTLREIVGDEWKKETELKGLKSEVSALERKIQLALTPPPEPTNADGTERKQEAVADNNIAKEHIIIPPPKPPTETARGFRV